MQAPMLPAKGPWPHPYYEIADTFVEVSFTDAEHNERRVRVRQKAVGDGPPLVLVHGLMTSSYSWRYVLSPLSRRYRVFAPDLVGAGASDKPLDFVYSVENVARFIVAYVRAVTDATPYLVGNSLGGLYSVKALLLDGALARRFVLMHAPGYPFFRAKLLAAAFATPLVGAGLAGLAARVAHAYPKRFVAKNVHYARKDMMSDEECVEYGRIFETLDGARAFVKILEDSLDPREHASVVAELRARKERSEAFPCPTKILYARKDVMVPPEFGPLYHADIPGSELVWMDDVSHFLHVDGPEQTVEQIVSFDRERDGSRGAVGHVGT
jgi:pimeloyl-ACP methyl ester carboxylesterase